MNHCVPRWDLLENLALIFPVGCHDQTLDGHFPMADTEAVAELTWQNGQLALQGLSHPAVVKPATKYPDASAAWEKQGQGGTLESIIDQATRAHLLQLDSISWPTPAVADALVPCSDVDRVPYPPPRMKRSRITDAGRICPSQGSCAPVTGKGESTIVTLDNTWVDDVGFTTNSASPDEVGFTTTSATPDGGRSPDTDSFEDGRPATTLDDHDSYCHSRQSLQKEGNGEDDEKVSKGETGRSGVCMKRRRASAIHNQSERKRRDKINERMKALQRMVPNSSKTDKASMLDEVIEYLKTLQAQIQVMKMSSMSHMMMPMPMAAMAQYQMTMMANMAQMSQMGMGMGMMEMNPLAQAGHPGMSSMLHPSASMHHLAGGTWGAANDRMPPPVAATPVMPEAFPTFLPGTTTQQPMGMDAFNRMATMYQQHYQQAPPTLPKP